MLFRYFDSKIYGKNYKTKVSVPVSANDNVLYIYPDIWVILLVRSVNRSMLPSLHYDATGVESRATNKRSLNFPNFKEQGTFVFFNKMEVVMYRRDGMKP